MGSTLDKTDSEINAGECHSDSWWHIYIVSLHLLGQQFYVLSMKRGLRFLLYECCYNLRVQGLKLQVCVNVNPSFPTCILQSNVFMYYGLSNFYQNHRRYVKSRDDSQLNGDNTSLHVGIPAWM